jgi:hypothetical protein
MRNYKKIAACPESLRRIIEGVNHLPVNADKILRRLVELARVAVNSSPNDFYANADFYRTEVKNLKLDKEVSDYLIGEMPGEIMMGVVAQNFNELMLAKPILRNIAEINRDEIKRFGKKAFTENQINPVAKFYTFNQKMRGIRFPGTLILIGGFIRPSVSGLAEVFQNQDIPPERIRECPVCQRIFWAQRLDAKTCGNKTCVDSLSGKKYQIENKAEINQKKREKYYKDNGIDFCPNCIRPQLTCECKTPQAFAGKSKDLID